MIPGFGWSVGDIIAGLKIVWDVWQAIADGPLNAEFKATQFFDDFVHVIGRLDDWEQRKQASPAHNRPDLDISNQQLREQCTLFIKRHMSLIQKANPRTKAIRQGRSTWLQKASFAKNEIVSLYQHVSWPFETKEVEGLRERLKFHLQLATYDVTARTHDYARDTHSAVQDLSDTFRTSNAELRASNLKLVSSHLDLVSLVTFNLKRVTYPLEPGRDSKEIDYPMLRHFEQALRPPRPLQALESPSSTVALPWRPRSYHGTKADNPATASHDRNSLSMGQYEVQGLITKRLDNMSMRMGRADTLESIPELDARENISTTTQPLLGRLKELRGQIGNAVGISHDSLPQSSPVIVEPETALREELEAWDHLRERIEREVLHPGRLLSQASETSKSSQPMDIPARKPSVAVSPRSSPRNSWQGPSASNSSNGRSLSSSPSLSRPASHKRSSSTSSTPLLLDRLEHQLPVHITYPNHVVFAVIYAISRFDDGDVQIITAQTQDGTTEIRHTVDLKAPSLIETSMKPFLDSKHVDSSKSHSLRVQFKGAHTLKITKVDKISRFQSPPTYTFTNEKDFLEFQSLLLNKEVKHCTDVIYIKSLADDAQCREGTIRILFDPSTYSRSILYFRHTPEQKDGFVEWPVSIFKETKEPGKKCRTLRLESHDGKALASSMGSLSRRSTSGSVATIASFETSAGPAFSRMQEKSAAKNIRGLNIGFCTTQDCHQFWVEFNKKDPITPSPMAQGLGFDFRAELP